MLGFLWTGMSAANNMRLQGEIISGYIKKTFVQKKL